MQVESVNLTLQTGSCLRGDVMVTIRDWMSVALRAGPSWMHWLMLALVGALAWAVGTFVDLTPHVDEDFFFSAKDPQFRQSKEIEQLFPSPSQIIISISSSDISSQGYFDRIKALGYNCDPSLKTPAEKPLFGVLITFIWSK